jgi:hypothetical protein
MPLKNDTENAELTSDVSEAVSVSIIRNWYDECWNLNEED